MKWGSLTGLRSWFHYYKGLLNVKTKTPSRKIWGFFGFKRGPSHLQAVKGYLGTTPFIRVHHSYIINYEQLTKIEENNIYIADKRIPVGEKFRERFMEVINRNKF
jgi:hypothetical protein